LVLEALAQRLVLAEITEQTAIILLLETLFLQSVAAAADIFKTYPVQVGLMV
jgi:hypothetical protein